MVWIIGEYAERIQNAGDLLTSFLETFEEDTPTVLFFSSSENNSQF